MAAARPIQFRSDKWTVVTAEGFAKSQEKAPKEVFLVQQFKTIVQGKLSQSSESKKRLSVAYLVDPENPNEKEHLYQTAYHCLARGEYPHGIEILEGLRKRTREVMVLYLLTCALLKYGTEIKSKDHLERAHVLSMETLKMANLSNDLRVDFILFTANSFIELKRMTDSDFHPSTLFEIIVSIDVPIPIEISNERRAQVALNVGIVRTLIGRCVRSKIQTDRQFTRAIELYCEALDYQDISPDMKCKLLYHLSYAYYTVGSIVAAYSMHRCGLQVAIDSCPSHLESYRLLGLVIDNSLLSLNSR